jgi:hypothetical protein
LLVRVPLALLVVLGGSLAFAPSEAGDQLPLRRGASLIVPGTAEGLAAVTSDIVRPAVPSRAALREAWRYARERGGAVSLAVVDTAGRLRGRDANRRYISASVVKAMLLVAELRRLEHVGVALDPGTESLLRAMIAYSDNDAADSIYYRVGDAGLLDVARSAGMRHFAVAGYWGNAQITAADMARFFSRLRRVTAGPHRDTALDLLGSVVRNQRWGVPRAAGRAWSVCFKGGWRATALGELVHQAAWLRDGERDLAIAVLTDGQPSRLYAIHTVRGIADRLLDGGAPERARG